MLAALVVHLKANYGNLTKGLSVARNSVTSTVGSIRRSLGGMVGSVVGLVGVAGAVAAITSNMQALDKIAKVNQRTGFGAETIAGLGLAADLGGSSVEGMNKSLEKFSVNMGLAAAGTGPGVNGLKMLGLSFSDLQGLQPDEQLMRVVDALAAMPNEAARNAAGVQLFGKSFVEIAPLMNQGRAGLQAFIDEAKNMGLGISSEELAKVEAANDAITRLKNLATGAISAITVAIAPMIERTAAGLQTWAQSLGGVGAMVEYVGSLWTWLQNMTATAITVAMTVATFAIDNWQGIAELAFNAAALSVVQFANQLVYFFSDVIPALLTWFGNNWRDIFYSAFDLATTVFINLGKNIRATMTAIWNFIKSGGTASFEVAWTPLTEGFVNSVKELPDIPERIIGPLEAQLASRVSELSNQLGGDLGQALDDNLAALAQQQAAANLPGVDKPNLPTLGGGDSADDAGSSDAAGGDKKFGALAKGSQEAASAIFAAMREKDNVGANLQQKQLAVQQQQLAAANALNAKLGNAPQLAVIQDL